MTDSDAAGLEAPLKIVEDKLAIYELIASHPPSADTGSADYTSSVYLEVRGPTLDGATGVENIAAFTLRPAHEQAIRDGLAHFAGLPLIDTVKTHWCPANLPNSVNWLTGSRLQLPGPGDVCVRSEADPEACPSRAPAGSVHGAPGRDACAGPRWRAQS
jgi:hypothetical protein